MKRTAIAAAAEAWADDAALAAHQSDPASEELEDAGLPLGGAPRISFAASLRSSAGVNALLRAAGCVSAIIAAFVLGYVGESTKLNVTALPRGTAVPLAVVLAVAVAYSATVALRKGGAAAFAFVGATAGVCALWSIAAAIGGAGGGGKGCAALVLHPHHYLMALCGVALLREHGLPPPFRAHWRRPQILFGVFVWLTKNALLGVAVQGLAQYGPDSILRATTCATTR